MSGGAGGLDAVFRPRSIAVIGASRERGTIGGEIFHNLVAHGFTGRVDPVNPRAAVVQSVRAYPAIEDVPGTVDLAVVVVPAAHVQVVVEACGKKGVRAAIVISAGFKELGGEGLARERALVDTARRHGLRLVGPNCLGVLNTEAAVRMDATFAPTYPPAGHVAFSSQSGALGLAILDLARELNVGISHFISVGNKADVSANDLLEYWEKDPGTQVILLYLESFGNPRRFIEIARRVGRTKPIVAVKSGTTRAGMRAASSHTGSLAGAAAGVDALCAQAGVIRTNTMEELFDVAMLLATQPVPAGRRVGIVTNAGGPGIMASDACETHGLEVPLLGEATVAKLRACLAPEASVRNPVDMIASASVEAYEQAVHIVAEDPGVDALLVLYVPPLVTQPEDVAQAIVRGTEAARRAAVAAGLPVKPVITCFMGSHGVAEGLLSLQESHLPSYSFPESAAIALARATAYGRWREQPDGALRHFDDVKPAQAAAAIARARARAGGGAPEWLRADEVREVLGAYRIASAADEVARDAEHAAAAARKIGFPVAVKLVSPAVTHKSDVGGVALDVRDERGVREAFTGIAARLAEHRPDAAMSGVVIQPMVHEGIEVIVGMTLDPSFGPLLMIGLGGVNVELLHDVAFRVHPLTDRDAREMMRSLRGYPLLEGWRGAPAADVAALEDMLLRGALMIGEQPDLVEMDLNPIRVLTPGRGCVAIDARIAVRGGSPGEGPSAKVPA